MEQEGRERPVYLCDRGTSTANPRPVLRSRDPPQPITGQVRLGSQCRSKLRAEVGQLQAGIVIGSLNYRNYQIQLILPYMAAAALELVQRSPHYPWLQDSIEEISLYQATRHFFIKPLSKIFNLSHFREKTIKCCR